MGKSKKYIQEFNPDVELLNIGEHQDFLAGFDCGHEAFNSFIQKEAVTFHEDGNGVTHLVFNTLFDENNTEKKELVGYYTLAASGIPCTSRIKLYEEDIVDGKEYDEQEESISVIEIKMFAVDLKYQDTFFRYEKENKPVSAYIMNYIVSHISDIIENIVAAKMIYLQAVDKKTSDFYSRNEFHCMQEFMHPIQGNDDGMIPMYMTLKPIKILYEL